MKVLLSTTLFLILLPLSEAFGEWKFSGAAGPYLNALNFSSSSTTPAQKAGLLTEMKLEKKINSAWRFKSELMFRNDLNARDVVERFQWIPKNFFVQTKAKSLTFRLGYQTLSIDGPDVINPADVSHARNYVDPTAPITIGSAGLSISQEIQNWNWEIFYVPVQTKPTLPGEHSPWLPRENRLPIESENTEMRIPKDVKYKYLSSQEIDDALKNNVTLKLQRKSEKLEAQLVYYEGLAQSPFLLVDATASVISSTPSDTVLLLQSPIGLRQLYYRQQAIAGTFMIPFESWAIRGGANWLKPRGSDERTPSESRSGVLGVEKSVETSFGLVTGIVQHIRQENLSQNQISFLRSIFERAWSGGVRIPFGEETTLLAGGVYDEIGRSSLYQASINHRITNVWSVEAGAKYLQGPKKTLLGLYDRYDSYQLKTLYYW